MKNEPTLQNLSDFENKSLLIVDDDNPFRERLARAMEKKGFEVFQAEGVQKGIDSVKAKKPGFAVVDLRLGDGNGLEVVKEIQLNNPSSRRRHTRLPLVSWARDVYKRQLANLSLKGLSSSTINKDLLSKSLKFCNVGSFFIDPIWTFFSTIQ